MFTGLIADVGRIQAVGRRHGVLVLEVATALADETLRVGDSLAVNGACLTVVAVSRGRAVVEAVEETVARTTVGSLRPGSRVNLERPLRLGDRLDGHLVQGHVDGVGRVLQVRRLAGSVVLRIGLDGQLLRYVAEKGSVAVDGVSLTVTRVDGRSFEVSLVPHTLGATNLGDRRVGDRVNVETDVLAKYVERLLGRGSSRRSLGELLVGQGAELGGRS